MLVAVINDPHWVAINALSCAWLSARMHKWAIFPKYMHTAITKWWYFHRVYAHTTSSEIHLMYQNTLPSRCASCMKMSISATSIITHCGMPSHPIQPSHSLGLLISSQHFPHFYQAHQNLLLWFVVSGDFVTSCRELISTMSGEGYVWSNIKEELNLTAPSLLNTCQYILL